MAASRSLQGACSCGRIKYIISIPSNSTSADPSSDAPPQDPSEAQVIFSTSSHDRRTQGTPLAAWLRVPLTWYSSSTHAFFDDESHATIRRTYIPTSREAEQRCFCAHCGTHLSRWTDDPPPERDWIAVTLGSLEPRDLDGLEEMGLLPRGSGVESEDVDGEEERVSRLLGDSRRRNQEFEEAMVTWPWFETMVKGTGLGRLTRRSGSRTEGGQTIEWEVAEWTGRSPEPEGTPGKRKRLKVDDLGAEVPS